MQAAASVMEPHFRCGRVILFSFEMTIVSLLGFFKPSLLATPDKCSAQLSLNLGTVPFYMKLTKTA